MSNKYYRVTLFDRNCIRHNIEFIVSATTKPMAIEVARQQLHAKALKQIELVTNGMAACTTTMLDGKGNEVVCTMREVSPEYYFYLIDECWGIADVMVIGSTSKSVSSESAVAKATEKLAKAQAECESEKQGDSSITRRKKRWTKAEKRAAKAAREAAKAAREANAA